MVFRGIVDIKAFSKIEEPIPFPGGMIAHNPGDPHKYPDNTILSDRPLCIPCTGRVIDAGRSVPFCDKTGIKKEKGGNKGFQGGLPLPNGK